MKVEELKCWDIIKVRQYQGNDRAYDRAIKAMIEAMIEQSRQ